MKRIWLDDLRDPAKYKYPEAVWLKTHKEFLEFMRSIEARQAVEFIHFDNDLGSELVGQEGYDSFRMVERKLYSGGSIPLGGFENLKEIHVHSSNSAAVARFLLAKEALLDRFGIVMIRHQY